MISVDRTDAHSVSIVPLHVGPRSLDGGRINEDRAKLFSLDWNSPGQVVSKSLRSLFSVSLLCLLSLIYLSALDEVAGHNGEELRQIAEAPEPVVI
jgi:hypothetical protein